jgi:2'-5' RNA ligase
MHASETALVVLVAEAEALVGPLRDVWDPAASAGMPAHITLVYPFRPRGGVGAEVVRDLADCFRGFVPFDYTLVDVQSFGATVLYLRPDPEEPLRRLIVPVLERYPETPPYGGAFSAIVPHLTIAHVARDDLLRRVVSDVSDAARGGLPIKARATHVALVDNASGSWRTQANFPLLGIDP